MAVAPIEPPAEVLEALARQREALDALAPRHQQQLLGISRDLIGRLERRMKGLRRGSWTARETQSVIGDLRRLADELAERFGGEMGEALTEIGRDAARVGRSGLSEQLAAWDRPDRAIGRAQLTGALLDDGLLEYYAASRAAYGAEAIAKMRRTMAAGVLAGESLAETWERMAGELDMPSWRAERIVRTEHSFAAHRRQIEDIKLQGDGDDWRKQLVATFDNRTGDDSKYVHEQIRRLDEPFADNEGRVYQHPPNRPNDREAMVLVPAWALEEDLDEVLDIDPDDLSALDHLDGADGVTT